MTQCALGYQSPPPTPLKVGFSVNPHNFFSSATPSYLLKVTKFLVKVSQFKFLAMSERNIFVYKLFCHEIFQILIYFLFENLSDLSDFMGWISFLPSYRKEEISPNP